MGGVIPSPIRYNLDKIQNSNYNTKTVAKSTQPQCNTHEVPLWSNKDFYPHICVQMCVRVRMVPKYFDILFLFNFPSSLSLYAGISTDMVPLQTSTNVVPM